MAKAPQSKKADPLLQEYRADTPVGNLRPHPNNPNEGDPEEIAASIEASGFAGAVLVQKSTGYIIAGEHTWRAVQARGGDTVPTITVDCGAVEAERLMIMFNKAPRSGRWKLPVLTEILGRLVGDGDPLAGLAGTGFSIDEFARAQDEAAQLALKELAAGLDPEKKGKANFGKSAEVDYEEQGLVLTFAVSAEERSLVMGWLRREAKARDLPSAAAALAALAREASE